MKDAYYTTEGEKLTPNDVARLINCSDYVVVFCILGETEDHYFRFGKFVSLSREIKAQDIYNIILNVLLAEKVYDILPEDIINLCVAGVTNDSEHVYCDLNPRMVWPTFEEMTQAVLLATLNGLKNDGENDVQ